MLIIYGCMQLGGIETFFLRLAKKSYDKGVRLNFLLLCDKSDCNSELINELIKNANVYFYYDIFKKNRILDKNFFLLNSFQLTNLDLMLDGIEIIHVTTAQHALLVNRILNFKKMEITLTVGVYHSQEFCWYMKSLPYFEKIHREFIFKHLSDKNLLCFSETTRNYLAQETNYNISNSKVFRLGVIDKPIHNLFHENRIKKNTIKICAVGRLIKFKTYNLWMLDVLKKLQEKNIDIIFDIYGDGPLKDIIDSKKGDLNVNLKGSFDYSQFNKIVSTYDLFIGSGTAIIQSAALGIPSIIGVESIKQPLTYGYFSDFYEYEYHNMSLSFKKIEVERIIEDFCQMSNEDKRLLSEKHITASHAFLMDNCLQNFLNPAVPYVNLNSNIKFNLFFYYLSKIIFYFYCKIFHKDIYYKGY